MSPESLPDLSERAQARLRDAHRHADRWERMQRFCLERGWNAELYVRDDRDQFGRIGVWVEQAGGDSMRAFGDTAAAAIGNMAMTLERDGFDG